MSEMLTSRQSGPGVVATLPHDVISVIRSGITTSSAGQCVEELVLNAIDADATQIFVGVDFRKFGIRVDDNGNGILKNDLVHVGTRYSTSKCHTLEDLNNLHSYGFRGEALASIIGTADGVELLSRSKSEEFCCRKTFRNGIQDERIVELPSSHRKTHGLCVTLVNFMGKFPVRQRRIDDSIEIEEIKSILERILVMNPLVALDYRNDATGAKILTVSRSPSVAIAFRNIFVQSRHGLALHENLMEAHFSHGVYFLKLYVSKAAHHSKHLELVYVNRRYMARGKIHRALHQSLTNVFGFEGRKSTTTNEDEDQNNSKNRSTSFGFRSETKTNVNKYPVFILNIECPLNEYDITFDPKKTVVEFKHWNILMEAVEGLKDRLKMTLKLEANQSIVVSKHSASKSSKRDSSQGQPIACSSKGVGKNITTHAMKRAVHSRVAVRGRGIDNGQAERIPEIRHHSASESEESPDVKSKDFNTKIQSKLHLSTVSRKRTDLEIKSLKRRNTADDTSVLSKKLCLVPKKSARPLARPGVGLLKNIKEKFSPWRIMLEGKEQTDRKKFLPWRGIPVKRKLTNDDVLSDKLSRLSMSHSDPESLSPSNDHPKSSRPSRLPQLKKKSRHLVPKKPKITFEESDNATDHSIQDEDQEDKEISQKQNSFNFQNKIVKDEDVVDGPEFSSSRTESADEESVGSRFMYNVLGSHMDAFAKTNGCQIEEWNSFAMIQSIRNSTVNSLAQSVEEEERSDVSDTSPSVGQPLKTSTLSVSSAGAVRLQETEMKLESNEAEKEIKVKPTENESNVHFSGADLRKVIGNWNMLMKEKKASRLECRELLAHSFDPSRFVRPPPPPSIFKIPCPKRKVEEDSYTQDIDEERKKLKKEVDSAHRAFCARVHSADAISNDAAPTLRLIKWLESTNRRPRESPFEPLANEQMVLPSPVREYDSIQPQTNYDKNPRLPIQDSQYLSPTQSDLASECNVDDKLEAFEYFEFPSFTLPELDYIPPHPHSRDSRPFPERYDGQLEGLDSMSDTEYITMDRSQYTRNPPSPPPFLRDYPQHQAKFIKLHQQLPTTCSQFPGLGGPPPPPKPSKAKRQVTATVTSATTTGAVNDLDLDPILRPGPSYFTAKPSRVIYEENSRNSFWDDIEEVPVQVQLDLNSYSQDSDAFVPIAPPSPQEFLHQRIEPTTSQIEDQIEGQGPNTVQKSVCFSPAIEINTNNTQEMEEDDEIEEEEFGSDNVNDIPTSIQPHVGDQGQDTVGKSVYFSQPEEINMNNTVEMEEDNRIDIEGEPGLQDSPLSPQDTSQYFQPFEEIDEPEIEGAVANEGQSETEICSKWADWEFEISVDVMGQEWLHTTDEFGHLKYVNLGTGNSSDHIVQVTGYEKLTATQAKLLNKTFRYNWLCKYFPKGSNKFWNPTATEDGKISKNGNMDLADEGSTVLGSSIRHCMKGEIEKIASKWKEGHLEESLCGGNCHNPENVMDNENYPTDASMSEVVRVCEYWERPTGSPQVPILNLNGPDINFFIKRADKQSCRFSKTDLNDVRVISQLDRKFIVTTIGNNNQNQGEEKTLLVLFDQHAVHERIRLEQLLAECSHEVEPGLRRILSVSVNPPITLTFEETENRILMNYRDQMKNLGVEYYFKDDGSINIASVPKCFSEKIANETYATRNNTMKRLLFSLLREQVNLILVRNGLVQNVPKTIFDILCSQACHGAIKFGDELALDVCQDLMDKLKNCVVPFQCAHGRPVLVPITDLKIQCPSSSQGLVSDI